MMQALAAMDRASARPCPGLVDDAGAVRDTCRACGRCDDVIRDMMRGTAMPSVIKRLDAPEQIPA